MAPPCHAWHERGGRRNTAKHGCKRLKNKERLTGRLGLWFFRRLSGRQELWISVSKPWLFSDRREARNCAQSNCSRLKWEVSWLKDRAEIIRVQEHLMRLRRSLLTRSNFLNAKQMYQQGVTLGTLLMWPIRSRSNSDRPHIFKLRDGTSFLAPREGLSFHLLWREIWVEEVYAQAGIRIAPEDTVVDIGANLGVFSLWASSRCESGRVVAVEPSPRMADFARRNAARNRRSNITVLQVACGGSAGRAVLYTAYGDEARNTLDPHSASSAQALAEVEVVTLSELFRRTNVENCNLLKIDCEGSEYDLLLKSPIEIFSRIHQIALEYHPGFNESDTPDKLGNFLNARGFDVSTRQGEIPGYGYLYARKLRTA